jgi:hypothetical protein
MAARPDGLTGKKLAKRWGVKVNQALLSANGSFYNHCVRFPAALFDLAGYIRFETEQDYLNCRGLVFGVQVHVPGGVARLPGYVKGVDA